MPLVLLLAVPLLALLLVVVLTPLGLVQRYRAGAARRVVRRWLADLNVAALSFSVFLLVGGAAITSLWAPRALLYALTGLAGGCLLGVLGLALTRWEKLPGRLQYTPNRFLALGIALLVAARLIYGVWRLWHGWAGGEAERAWLMQSGVPGSLGVGAVVLGYALSYWMGVSVAARRHRASV